MEFSKLNLIVQKFFINTKVLNIKMIDSGLTNKTYIVEHLYDGIESKFILQSLSKVFESHEIVNTNHKLITDHINKKTNNSHFNFKSKRWEVPNLIRCQSNKLFAFPFESDFWRAMEYIDETFSIDSLEDERMAYQAGIGLAKFHLICSDLDCSELKDSMKNFHNTKYYIDQYIRTLSDHNLMRLDIEVGNRLDYLVNCLSKHIGFVDLLLKSLGEKSLQYNVIHGDPKLSNFLFDIHDKYVVSLIDLDTVSSGYLLTDLADCLRSICNFSGEDPKRIENVSFDINSSNYFLKGYFSLSNKDEDKSLRFLPEFIYLIIFELTIRFLTDFLQSNRYFNIKYETHNLFRAEVQYQLLSSFLSKISCFSDELHDVGIYSSPTFVSDVQKIV